MEIFKRFCSGFDDFCQALEGSVLYKCVHDEKRNNLLDLKHVLTCIKVFRQAML